MKKLLALFSILLTLGACNTISDNPNATEDAAGSDIENLQKEVMAVHDTAMGKMNTISQLQRKLKETWKSAKDSLPYMDAHHNLGEAHSDMMGWMRSYEVPEDADEEEIREYLLEEKRAVEAVNANMDKSIEEARFLLKNSPVAKDVLDEPVEEEHSHQH